MSATSSMRKQSETGIKYWLKTNRPHASSDLVTETLSQVSAISQEILRQAWYPRIGRQDTALLIEETTKSSERDMSKKAKHKVRANRTKINLYLDIALTVAFIVSLRPFLTGLAVHEWLGLAIGGALAAHLVLHWKWVIGVTQKVLGSLPSKTRVYYALDVALLVAFLTIIGSGLAMSRVVLSFLGMYGSISTALVALHKLSSYLTLVLIGVKLVLRRRWIANAIRNHVYGWPRIAQRQRESSLQAYEQRR